MEGEETAVKHLVASWGKVAAVIGSLAAIATFLANLFGWRGNVTLSVVALASIILIINSAMIDRVARKHELHDKAQDKRLEEITQSMDDRLNKIEKLSHEGLCSSLRTEMNSIIRHHPENHELILMYAERYFCDLASNWSETSIFMNWVDSENAAGRPVSIPPQLFQRIEISRNHERI